MWQRKLGILGGMGPLASAEFLATVYRLHLPEREQEAPVCVLASDPTFPDRTEAILSGSEEALEALAGQLTTALEALAAQGADRMVIACVTVHHVLGRVPEPLRRRVIPLIDLVIDEILASRRRHLLLTTTGTRSARIFEDHRRWGEVAARVTRPGGEDQERLHATLYRLKRGEAPEDALPWVASLPGAYGVEGLIFGCTELHLLQRPLRSTTRAGLDPAAIVDPLWTAARDLPRLLE